MIRHIELVHFKAFRELSLELAPLTMLAGLNSAGKSTVLQALALLRQSLRSPPGDALLLNGPLVELGTGRELLCEAADAERVEIALRTGAGAARLSAAAPPQADVLPFTTAGPAGGVFEILTGTDVQFLRADRITPATMYPRSHEQAVRQRSLGSRGEFTPHFLLEFGDVPTHDDGRRKPGATPGIVNQVAAWMAEVSPGVRLDLRKLDSTEFVQLRFGWGASGFGGSLPYRPTHVGFGLTYTLPVVVALLSAAPGGLVMLENPEAHVHPRGQLALGRLAALAAAAGVQVIIETHSDHVLNGIRLAAKRQEVAADHVAIHFFRRPPGGGDVLVERPVLAPDGALSRWPVDFFDQWDKALDGLLE
jgi:predicted ATPase